MPKKTRRQKQRAQERRTAPVGASPPSHSSTPTLTYQFSGNTAHAIPTQTQAVSLVDETELKVIRRELFKTTMLAISAVALELVIFWKLR